MGMCCGKPAKCAHASSETTLSPSKSKQYQTFGEQKHHESLNNLKIFTLNDLKIATKNFRPDSLLGEGGFGCVFKGIIDENPTKPGARIVVAVKKLKCGSSQGHREWLTEVDYLGQLQHENLVKLIGYCSESKQKLLVYEYMSKGSLDNHLFRKNTCKVSNGNEHLEVSRMKDQSHIGGIEPISWATRMRIAIDVARGLSFLHSLDANVIYRDLKASNILLDSDYNAKLSDFGLARAGPTGDRTHVSTRVVGTQGYAAPEYVATGHLTPKSDVYSFGVVLLELLSGKRALGDESNGSSEETLVDWAKPFLADNRRVLRIMDTRLGGQYPKRGAYAAASLALECLNADHRLRPTMAHVLSQIEQLQNLSRDAPRAPSQHCATNAKPMAR